MDRYELEIKLTDDRLDMARILIKNGYRVWTETRKTGSKSVVLLMYDRKEKDAHV